MVVAKGPGGAYWKVMNDEGEVVSTHPTKEEADKAAEASKSATYQNKMAAVETVK